MTAYLSYGVVGLGLALAILSYRLLSAEQMQARPRRDMIKSIYSFMIFSIIIVVFGLALEIYKLVSNSNLQNISEHRTYEDYIKLRMNKEWQEAITTLHAKIAQNRNPVSSTLSNPLIDQIWPVTMTFRAGQCLEYIASAGKTASILVGTRSDPEVKRDVITIENSLEHGKICYTGTNSDKYIDLRIRVRHVQAPFIVEFYEVKI